MRILLPIFATVLLFAPLQGNIFYDLWGYDSLHHAISHGSSRGVQQLLDQGSDPNGKGFGTTPLKRACLNKNLEIVEILVENGANLEGALHDASTPEIAQYFIKQGCDVNEYNSMGFTPLMRATGSVAEFLIASGASLERKDNDGDTPLMHATGRSDTELVTFYVGRGANLEAKDNFGRTALALAADRKSYKMVKFLISLGSDINSQGDTGMTPLMFAAFRGDVGIAAYLLSCGADPLIKTINASHFKTLNSWDTVINAGATALTFAKKNSNTAVIELLSE